MTNLAVFASGQGTNAEAIIQYFGKSSEVSVTLVVCNNPDAGVVAVAKKHQIPLSLVNKKSFYDSVELLDVLKRHEVRFIVLAGFLWQVPEYLLKSYPGKIINIHPALLPKYGGKGMYGRRVHEAVLKGQEKESGITIHYVNENYDEGEIIFQAKCPVETGDDAASLEAKVRRLELEYYPKTIEKLLIKEPVTT